MCPKTLAFINFTMLKYAILFICLMTHFQFSVAGENGKETKNHGDTISKKLSRQKRYSHGLLGEYLRHGNYPRNNDYDTMYEANRRYEGDYGDGRGYGNGADYGSSYRYVNNEDYGRDLGNYDTSETTPVERPYNSEDSNSFRDYATSQWDPWRQPYYNGYGRGNWYDAYYGRYRFPTFDRYNGPSGELWNGDRLNEHYRRPSGTLWNNDRFDGNIRGETDLSAYYENPENEAIRRPYWNDNRPLTGQFTEGENRPNNIQNPAPPIKEGNTQNGTKEGSKQTGTVDTEDRFRGSEGRRRDFGYSDNRHYGNTYGKLENTEELYDTVTNERDQDGFRDYDRYNRRYDNREKNKRPRYDTSTSDRYRGGPRDNERNSRRNRNWEKNERRPYDTVTNERVREGNRDYDRSNRRYGNSDNYWPY